MGEAAVRSATICCAWLLRLSRRACNVLADSLRPAATANQCTWLHAVAQASRSLRSAVLVGPDSSFLHMAGTLVAMGLWPRPSTRFAPGLRRVYSDLPAGRFRARPAPTKTSTATPERPARKPYLRSVLAVAAGFRWCRAGRQASPRGAGSRVATGSPLQGAGMLSILGRLPRRPPAAAAAPPGPAAAALQGVRWPCGQIFRLPGSKRPAMSIPDAAERYTRTDRC